MLDILAELSVAVQKPNLIWPTSFLLLWLGACRFCGVKLLVLLGGPCGYFLHEHENLINPCNVPLNLCDVMLEYCRFDALSTPQALHDASILVADVPLDNSLDRFNFIEPVV